MGLFFELPQHTIPQKITFFMKICYYENRDTVQSEKPEKSQFYCFHPCHIGVLCSKLWHPIGPLKCGPMLIIFTFFRLSFSQRIQKCKNLEIWTIFRYCKMQSKFYYITRLCDMGENSKIDFFQVFHFELYFSFS